MRFPLLLAVSLVFSAGGLAGCAGDSPAIVGERTPAAAIIDITARGRDAWTVEYRLPSQVAELAFARSPDDSRGKAWTAPAGFEFAYANDVELLRRMDGAPFDIVTLQAPPVYRYLPKDYAPFSPFGDGGMLVHSGRFFACGGPCPDNALFAMSLTNTGAGRILLDGTDRGRTVAWTDTESGRNVYVGDAEPVETPDFIAVIDASLPNEIREQLGAQFPQLMHIYAERLGAVSARPMMFVSYDLSHPGGGWGRQGGVLPDQVFMHFYGSVWPEEMQKDGFVEDLTWHFAHEAAHIYQRQILATDEGSAWIHEGAAEAFAYLVLRDRASTHSDAAVASARAACEEQLDGRAINTAISAGTFDAAYSCGLLLNLDIDAGLKAAGVSDGLFAAWRAWMADVEGGGAATQATYLEALERLGGKPVAERAARLAGYPSPAFN